MAQPNEVMKGRYAMSNGSLINKNGETVPFAALAIVSYDGITGETGAGAVGGAGVTKTPKSVATLNAGGPEPLALNQFTIADGSKYWVDPEKLTGRALFLYDFHDGNPPHTVHYYFAVIDGGKELQFVVTASAPQPSVQSGTQRKISNKPLP